MTHGMRLPFLLALLLIAAGCQTEGTPDDPLPQDDLRVIHRGGVPLPDDPDPEPEPEAAPRDAPVLGVTGRSSGGTVDASTVAPDRPVIRLVGPRGRTRGVNDSPGIRHQIREAVPEEASEVPPEK